MVYLVTTLYRYTHPLDTEHDLNIYLPHLNLVRERTRNWDTTWSGLKYIAIVNFISKTCNRQNSDFY